MVEACLMAGKIDLSARRQVANKLRDAYGRTSKPDNARILDEVQAAIGAASSTARRLLSGPRLPDPAEQVDRRQPRPRAYGDPARELLAHVWKLMGLPCRKYFVATLPGGFRCSWRPGISTTRSRPLRQSMRFGGWARQRSTGTSLRLALHSS